MSFSNRLNTFLTMPPSLRLAMIGAPARVRPRQLSLPLKVYRSTAAWNHAEAAAFCIPELRQGSIASVSFDTLCEASRIRSAPDEPLLSGLSTLFTKNPATFQYGETDFYKLKKNTLLPEVCVLGRSNVGKSSFVNALAGRNQRSQNPLARISKHAGKTREMNTYGFGPAPLPKDILAWSAEVKGQEDMPTRTFYLVDMPGYGHASLEGWGRNITLYLTKRVGVKGAIILIDAEVGPKETDLQCLRLLSSANMRTCIVLTKADKVKGGLSALHDLCAELRDHIVQIEKSQQNYDWNLEREVFVTALGAKDPTIVQATVSPARLAVARLAGLVENNRPEPEKNKKWSGKIISFEDLQYAPKDTTAKQVYHPAPTPSEWATQKGYEAHHGIRLGVFDPLHSRMVTQPQVRNFHSDSRRMKGHGQSSKKSRFYEQEMNDVLDDFINEMKATTTTSHYVRNMRRKNNRRLPQPPEKRNLLDRKENKIEKALRKRFPDDVARTLAVREERTSGRRQEQGRKKRQTEEEEEEWPSTSPVRKRDDSNLLTPDAFKALVTGPEPTKTGNQNNKKNPGKKNSKGNKKEEPVDEFEAKFARAFSKIQ
ncbi:uncharacterized protein F4812DRAFT_42211 [Daldinia caldariorum]|uniref:uncharacterized protein n=1 Tax=Daldinia caldariorum TaxID=326644 RepID=UPI00200843FB|nr:uncharacterized protein F4812DRAFT_42211 [Daldinia caldariorum]KAI1473191.1 hypothetical protein F4812DRAFT_42211 [Daldinia caldariorum]